uniref:Uncharacterized protein n=1 Tax=Arundo donax TaxID=35708 RepID=A0A0A9A5W0_ARUDO
MDWSIQIPSQRAEFGLYCSEQRKDADSCRRSLAL